MHLPKNKTKKWLKKSFSIQFNLTEPIRESSRSGHYSQHDYHQQNGQEESNHNNADGHHHQDETKTVIYDCYLFTHTHPYLSLSNSHCLYESRNDKNLYNYEIGKKKK